MEKKEVISWYLTSYILHFSELNLKTLCRDFLYQVMLLPSDPLDARNIMLEGQLPQFPLKFYAI